MVTEREPTARVFTWSTEVATRVVDLASAAGIEVAVHVCTGNLADAVANARAAEVRLPSLAVVEGRNGAAAALGLGVDEVIEERVLSPELLSMAVRLASERMRHLRDREVFQRSLAHREQLAALGTVVAGAAHEIANPAAVVALNLEGVGAALAGVRERLSAIEASVRGWPTWDARLSAPRAEVLHSITSAMELLDRHHAADAIADALASVRVIRDLVRDLRIISRSKVDDVPPEVVDLGKLVKQVLRLAGVESTNVHVELDCPDEVPLLWLPRSRLMQIVTNLIANANHAMSEIARPLHRLRVMIRQDETALMLAVSDTGIGISAAQLDRMFEPFFTTKGPEHGTGLGLFMSREIVRKLGGDLTIDSVEGEGTTALIFLPMALRTTALTERSAPSTHRPRVMLVDTDLERLRSLDNQLRSEYDVVIARGAVEALDVLESGARVDAILGELEMPEMDGRGLFERVRSRWPSLVHRLVFFTREPTGADADRALRVVQAPSDRRALIDMVRDVLAVERRASA